MIKRNFLFAFILILVVLLVGILSVNVSVKFVSAAEGDNNNFNPDDPLTWGSASSSQLASLTSKQIYDAWKSFTDIDERFEKAEIYWKRFNSDSKNGFVETVLRDKFGAGFKVSGMGHADLKLEYGELRDEYDAKFNIGKPPELKEKGLQGLSYDSKTGFTYEFSDGRTIKLRRGYLDSELIVRGSGSNVEDFKWNEKGSFTLTENNVYYINDGAELTKGDVTFRQYNEAEQGIFVSKNPKGLQAYIVNAIVEGPNGIIKDNGIKNAKGNMIGTFTSFEDRFSVSHSRMVRISDSEIEMKGDQLYAEFFNDMKDVSLLGNEIELKNGPLTYKTDNEGRLMFPRSMTRDFEGIKTIEKISDNEISYFQKTDSDGAFLRDDFEKKVVIGAGVRKFEFIRREHDTVKAGIFVDFDELEQFENNDAYLSGEYKTFEEFAAAMGDDISQKGFQLKFLRDIETEKFLRNTAEERKRIQERAIPLVASGAAAGLFDYAEKIMQARKTGETEVRGLRGRLRQRRESGERPLIDTIRRGADLVDLSGGDIKLKPPAGFEAPASIISDSKKLEAFIASYDIYKTGSVMRYETNSEQGTLTISQPDQESKTIIVNPDLTRFVIEDAWETNPRYFKNAWKKYAQLHDYAY